MFCDCVLESFTVFDVWFLSSKLEILCPEFVDAFFGPFFGIFSFLELLHDCWNILTKISPEFFFLTLTPINNFKCSVSRLCSDFCPRMAVLELLSSFLFHSSLLFTRVTISLEICYSSHGCLCEGKSLSSDIFSPFASSSFFLHFSVFWGRRAGSTIAITRKTEPL